MAMKIDDQELENINGGTVQPAIQPNTAKYKFKCNKCGKEFETNKYYFNKCPESSCKSDDVTCLERIY